MIKNNYDEEEFIIFITTLKMTFYLLILKMNNFYI